MGHHIEQKIASIRDEWEKGVWDSEAQIALFRKRYLGKQGAVKKLIGSLKQIEGEERKRSGEMLNRFKQEAELFFEVAQKKLSRIEQKQQLDDFTAPMPKKRGSIHPLTHVMERAVAVLSKVGFEFIEGREIEQDWYNFKALNFPEHHPARAMQDSFFLDQDKKHLLRTQTSSVQIRHLEKYPFATKIITAGKVYRKEQISARSHAIFHQLEALYIDEKVGFIDLKQILKYFIQSMFGKETQMRLRPSFFPFTEPSLEIDISCSKCEMQGCTLCKGKGWVEIGGAGMVDPNVLKNCKVDPRLGGYAFGLGIDRIAMILIDNVTDIRDFTLNHLAFLKQFPPTT